MAENEPTDVVAEVEEVTEAVEEASLEDGDEEKTDVETADEGCAEDEEKKETEGEEGDAAVDGDAAADASAEEVEGAEAEEKKEEEEEDDGMPERSKPPERVPPAPPPKVYDTPSIFSTRYDTGRTWEWEPDENDPNLQAMVEEAVDVDVSGTPVADQYDIGRIIGVGPFSIVKLAKKKDGSGQAALKLVSKDTAPDFDTFAKESAVLKAAQGHANVVAVTDVVQTDSFAALALELLDGDLNSAVLKEDTAAAYTEADARKVAKAVVDALAHLHSKNIVHRDVVLENILRAGDAYKLGGFSLAREVAGGAKLENDGLMGSPNCSAPEIVQNQDIGFAADMWSFGVVVYTLLSGVAPFADHNQMRLRMKIRQAKFEFPSSSFAGVSDEAQDLVKKLIVVDEGARLTAEQAAAHPWFQSSSAASLGTFRASFKESFGNVE
eukprot:TRINITY_DN27_c1_g1_i1.p1 TRINITY_DN27_c1_g1~~TRINITY_DN27_c1_g1_i1.p1  ORF type:complete len:455 (-),score=158.15 TRINITY_DN27_c1_g1_i1:132-1445(-)